MLHSEWVPQYLRVVEAHTGDELEFLILGRIFQLCTVTESPLYEREESVYAKDWIKSLDKSVFLKKFGKEGSGSTDSSRQKNLLLIYKVCCTSPYRAGLEFICDLELMQKMAEEKK